jgi:hypothetical protein
MIMDGSAIKEENYLKKLKKPISIFKHISLLENSGFVL